MTAKLKLLALETRIAPSFPGSRPTGNYSIRGYKRVSRYLFSGKEEAGSVHFR